LVHPLEQISQLIGAILPETGHLVWRGAFRRNWPAKVMEQLLALEPIRRRVG
jgi:hypothetical protein